MWRTVFWMVMPCSGDEALIQIVDAAVAEAAQRAGEWLACRPGCAQCCLGVFAISEADVRRLRDGLAALRQTDAGRAERVTRRASEAALQLRKDFPGCDAPAFEDFANGEPCPALDPITLTCDLYAARPLTCRVFGPPLRCGEDAIGVCELCFEGAAAEDVARCEVEIDSAVWEELESGPDRTIVAFALAAAEQLPGRERV